METCPECGAELGYVGVDGQTIVDEDGFIIEPGHPQEGVELETSAPNFADAQWWPSGDLVCSNYPHKHKAGF